MSNEGEYRILNSQNSNARVRKSGDEIHDSGLHPNPVQRAAARPLSGITVGRSEAAQNNSYCVTLKRCSKSHKPPRFLLAVLTASLVSAETFSGTITDPSGNTVASATVSLLRRADSNRHETKTNAEGQYSFESLEAGQYRLVAEAPGFPIITRNVEITPAPVQTQDVQFTATATQAQSVTVTGDISDLGLFAPDPAQRIMIRDETLDANPGRAPACQFRFRDCPRNRPPVA